MKKCVKCGRNYDDSLLVCEICDLYLIKDVAYETKNSNNESYGENNFESSHIKNEASQTTNRRSGGRRSRVVSVDEGENVNSNSSNNPDRRTVFSDSDEDSIEPIYTGESRRTARRQRKPHRFGRRLLPVMRIAVPIILIIVAAIFIIMNWVTIREFLRACIIGALVGGTIIIFLSLRSGRYFNPNALLVGALGGAVVGCILKYNFLGTTVELTELIYALMPCVIECAGIWLILRSIFRR